MTQIVLEVKCGPGTSDKMCSVGVKKNLCEQQHTALAFTCPAGTRKARYSIKWNKMTIFANKALLLSSQEKAHQQQLLWKNIVIWIVWFY